MSVYIYGFVINIINYSQIIMAKKSVNKRLKDKN